LAEFSQNISAYLNKLFGEESSRKFSEFIDREPARYIRVNRLKTTPSSLTDILRKDYGINPEPVPGLEYALKLSGRIDLTGKTIEHIIGEYYMQGLSSMIPPLVLSPSENDVVLDLCAAPGSKTTEIAELMNNKGTLIANEIAMERTMALLYNIERMNIVNTGVLHFKGEMLGKIYSSYFDKILVDAPCSGLGILQKKEEVNDWWSEERAKGLGEIQLRLLVTAIKMLKPGGEIVYSTCTLAPEENEAVIHNILSKYPVELIDFSLPLPSHPGFTSYEGSQYNSEISKTKRILPWEADTDGFFIAKIRKTEETSSPDHIDLKKREFRFLSPGGKELKMHLKKLGETFNISGEVFNRFKYHMRGSDIYFTSAEWEDENPGIFERVGSRFGIIDKKNEITLHSQAAQILQENISRNIYLIEDQEEFRKYIEGGTIKKILPAGQYAVKYKNYILGTAVAVKEGLKSRFPRAKRTQGIYY
jgi:16S rRNA (cytosine1407-C5)-methyltransferase